MLAETPGNVTEKGSVLLSNGQLSSANSAPLMSVIPSLSSVSLTVADYKMYIKHFPEGVLLHICSTDADICSFRILSNNLCDNAVKYKHSISNGSCVSFLLFLFLSTSQDS